MYGSKKVIGKMPDMKTFANWERVGGNNAIVEHVQGLLLYHHLHWPLETPPPPPPFPQEFSCLGALPRPFNACARDSH